MPLRWQTAGHGNVSEEEAVLRRGRRFVAVSPKSASGAVAVRAVGFRQSGRYRHTEELWLRSVYAVCACSFPPAASSALPMQPSSYPAVATMK